MYKCLTGGKEVEEVRHFSAVSIARKKARGIKWKKQPEREQHPKTKPNTTILALHLNTRRQFFFLTIRRVKHWLTREVASTT